MENFTGKIKQTLLYINMVLLETEKNHKTGTKIMKAILSLFTISLILICLIIGALVFLPNEEVQLINDFVSEYRVALVYLLLSFLGAILSFPLLLIYEASKIHKKQESNKKELQDEIIELKKRPAPVKMKISRYAESYQMSTIPPYDKIGVLIKNNESVDITDIKIKLVKATDWEFSEESMQAEDVKWNIPEDNCYIDLGTNTEVEAGNERPFYFAKIQGDGVVFLLVGGNRKLQYREKLSQPGYWHWFVTCEMEFEIYGKRSGDSFKERYFAVIESQRTESFANANVKSETSIGIREDIIHVQEEETEEI